MKNVAKIKRLTALQIAASDIADIIGKSLNYVTATQSQLRKRKAKDESE